MKHKRETKQRALTWAFLALLLLSALPILIYTSPNASALTTIDTHTGKACIDVTTCNLAFTTGTANVVLAIFVAAFSATTPTAVAIHGLTPTKWESNTKYTDSELYGVVVPVARAYTIYVNFSAASYYTLSAVDFAQTVVTSNFGDGIGTGFRAAGTDAECNVTVNATSSPTETLEFVSVKTTAETTPSAGVGMTGLDREVTTSSVETSYGAYLTMDQGTPSTVLNQITIATANSQTVCVGILGATIPPDPTGIHVTAYGDEALQFAWTNAPSPLTGVSIYQAPYTGGLCGGYVLLYNSVVISTYDTGNTLGPSTGYCFEVFDVNSTGSSPLGDTLTDAVTLAVPAAATGLSVTPVGLTSKVGVELAWTPPYGAPYVTGNETLEVWRTSTCSGSPFQTIVTDTNLSAVNDELTNAINGIPAGAPYSFTMQYYDSNGKGTTSACAAGYSWGYPAAPTAITETRTTTSVSLTWTNPTVPSDTPLDNVSIYYGTTTSVTTHLSEGVVTTATISGLSVFTWYYFTITAWENHVNGTPASSVHTFTYAYLPPAPVNLQATQILSNQATFVWVNPSLGAGYSYNGNDTFYYATTCDQVVSGTGGYEGSWPDAISVGANGTTYTLTGLTPDTAYCVSVTEWTEGGQSPQAVNVTFATSGLGIPILSAAGYYNAILMNWTAVVGEHVASYEVFLQVGLGPATYYANVSALAYTWSSHVGPNLTYYVWVTGGGEKSNIVPVHTPALTPPNVVAPVLTAAGTYDTAVMYWTAAQNVTVSGYETELIGGSSVYYANVSASTFTYTYVTHVAANTTYLIEVLGGGLTSNVAVIHTPALTPKNVMDMVLSAAGTYNSALLYWTAPQNVTVSGYETELISGSSVYYANVSASTFTYTYVTHVAANTTYLLEVLGGGLTSNIAVIHTPALTPKNVMDMVLSAAGTYNSALLYWTSPQNVTVSGYETELISGSSVYYANVSASTFTYTYVTHVAANTTYLLEVLGGGLTSNIAVIHTPALLAPNVVAPVLTGVAVSIDDAWLNWSAEQNVSGFCVMPLCAHSYEVEMVYPTNVAIVVGLALNYSWTGLSPNQTYVFEVGAWTVSSNFLTVHTPATNPPGTTVYQPPILSVAGLTLTSVTLAWTAPTNVTVTDYEIQYGTTYNVWPHVVNEHGALEAVMGGLSSNTTYFFEVIATTAGGPEYSNVAPAHTLQVGGSNNAGSTFVEPWGELIVLSIAISMVVSAMAYGLTRSRRASFKRGRFSS